MDLRMGEGDSGTGKSFWLKSTDLANSLEYSLLTLPQPSHQWDIVQAQEEWKKEEAYMKNTSGPPEPAPDLGFVLAVERSLKGNSQWDLVQPQGSWITYGAAWLSFFSPRLDSIIALWQMAFSKNYHNSISHPMCSFTTWL